MKKLSLLILLLASVTLSAQDRDSLLRHINQIKRDTDRYLYGLATVPGNADPEASREAAAKELSIQVEAYLNTDDFVFLKEKKTCPPELVEQISCLLRPETYRTILYVEKSRLVEAEAALAAQLGSDTRKEDLSALVKGILEAQTLHEVLDLIAASPLAPEIRTGQKIDNETQQYVNDGILVYFHPKNKKILEVMTPMDEKYTRKNAKTGAPAQPMRYKDAPLWIYVEGLKNNNVL